MLQIMQRNNMAAHRNATTVGNLFFGCGILDDMSEIRLIDTSQTLGDQNVRFVARWKAGVQVGLLEEVTYYS